jgi:transportin-3
MFKILQRPNVTWEATEAALFIMECIARNIFVQEDQIVPKVIEAIIHLPDNCHPAIRYISTKVLGQLCDWIDEHPNTLDTILNYLMAALQRKGQIASAAAHSLQLICSSCHRHMIHHINSLIEIAKYLEMFEIEPEAAIVLLKGISTIISRLPNNEIPNVMRQLCNFQIEHLCKLIEANSKEDPTQWIDRLASIYRHVDPKVVQNETNPATEVIIENWTILSKIMDHHQHDSKIMERIIRTVRYAIRCIGAESLPILELLVKQMVEIYVKHNHSCLLYLGSVLVDEFGNNIRCIAGLLKMLEAFIEPTFKILQTENGLKNNPDTVDDFFRLAVRFIQRMPLHFLQSPIVAAIIQCATLACTLDHRDANMSVMKFLTNLLSNQKVNQMPEVSPYVQQIVQVHGECLVVNLLGASIYHLHPNQLSDVTDVFMEIKILNKDVFSEALQKALGQLPRRNAGGSVTATDQQLTKFYESMTK